MRDGITTTLVRNGAGQVLSESYSGGLLAGFSVTNGYDNYLRRTSLVLRYSSNPLLTTTYGYGDASRLATVTSGSYSAAYSYLENSPFVSQIAFKQSSTTRMTTTKQYDFLNRLQDISSSGTQLSTPASFNYSYNDANQRTRINLGDGSFWMYEYDALGQVKSGKRYWSDWTPVAGQQFEYGFDDIGNRQNTKAGGDENGANLRSASYTVNSLNQYTQRTVPGYVDIKGLALANNSVTVNSQTPYRRGEYFRKELSVGNGSASVWQGITVAAPMETSVTGNIYVPKTPEVFSYDADGNLTQDGRWNLGWDGEKNTANGPQQRIEFKYDWMGRRIGKKVWNNTAGTGTPVLDLRFGYDGWNLIGVGNQTAILQTFVWGTDLSGTMQGAGGVGGLLAVNDTANGTHFVAMDGNGNVAALVKGTDGTASANYEYGPFDEPIRVTGAMSKLNPFRFSTKYQDDETDWLYYGFRYYDQSTGRWLSRDPLEEGGLNLVGFGRNDGINGVDLLGLRMRTAFPRNCGELDDLDSIEKALDSLERDFKNWRKHGGGYADALKGSCNGAKRMLDLLGQCCGPWSPQQKALFDSIRDSVGKWCGPPPPGNPFDPVPKVDPAVVPQVPEPSNTGFYTAVGIGSGIIVGTIIEDVLTGGLGVADDAPTIGAGFAIIRTACQCRRAAGIP